nr:MAG: ABC transporter ATP-binding protein [Bacillota bacterium]
MSGTPAIAATGLVKVYPGGVVANDGVSLEVEPGTIHAVVGENGAGKSTLMNLLYGLERPTAGEIRIRGEVVHLRSPHDAIARGVGMVHQHFMLFPSLTVTENVVLGREPGRFGRFDRRAAAQKVAALAEQYRLPIDPLARVGDLPVGLQQRVEILKTLYRGAEIIILDEPTAVLTPQESDELLNVMRHLKAQGKTILFISHKLAEVLAVADRITVMRGGRVVAERKPGETNLEELATLMVGRLPAPPAVPRRAPGEPVLQVEDLQVRGPRGDLAVRGVSFAVRRGEIVGIAGVAGNGQSELVAAITGLLPAAAGRILLDGREITHLSVRQRREAGMAHVPEDRYRWGSARDASVADTAAMGPHYRPPLSRRGLIDRSAWRRRAEAILAEYRVQAAGLWVRAGALSGGNLQKLVVGRELSGDAHCLVVAEPSRGVDVAAAAFIHEQLLARRERGDAILLVSADLSELMALSDRILVMFKGRIVGEVGREEATERQIGLWMAGADQPAAAEGGSAGA